MFLYLDFATNFTQRWSVSICMSPPYFFLICDASKTLHALYRLQSWLLLVSLIEAFQTHLILKFFRSSHQRCSIKKFVLKVCKIHRKIPVAEFSSDKETPTQVFSCEYCEICKNRFFIEHLWLLLLIVDVLEGVSHNYCARPIYRNMVIFLPPPINFSCSCFQ